MVGGVIDSKKCEGAVVTEKQLFLRLWNFELLKELCLSKGIPVTEKSIDPNNNVSTVPISFYVLTETVSKTVNSAEIIFFAKQKGLPTEEFEKKLLSIKQFYGVQ